jgi:diguanylate cyclase (GGDEF)-like protein
MTAEHAKPQRQGSGRLTIVPIAAWTLWEQPSRVLVYVLTVEVATALLIFGALREWAVTPSDLTLALTIWGCAALHIEMTRSIERIRERASLTPHIDLNSMWTYSAVLLVHPALVAAIVSANYLHRWLRVRHHVVHRQTFSAAATVLASYAAIGILIAANQHRALSGHPHTVAAYLATVAAAITYLMVSTVLVSGAIVLRTPRPTFAKLAADPGDTALELAGIGLGVLIAWSLVDWPAALTIVFGVALVLHGKVLVRQLRNAARSDPKTGLLNLPAWINAAQQRVTRADAEHCVGLLMIDLDHFKLVNDVHGHLLGDEVLFAVAMAITDEVRVSDVVVRTDLVGRFGGEEFVVLLSGASETTIVTVAERIRHRIGSISIVTPGDDAPTDTMVRVTCSVGAAICPQHGTSLDQLLQAADHALRAAKQSGRNRVRLAGRWIHGG